MSSLWLNDFKRDITSQNGEDGVLEAIFDKIGVSNKWCCEFGAWDGKQFSNTYNLIAQHGWSGVLIESDPNRFSQLVTNMSGFETVTTLQAMVQESNFETILSQTPIPKDFDLLSIDIDGEDYLVWQALESYRPRVVVIEVHSGFPPGISVVPKRGHSPHGASIEPMVELAKRKGYELALHTGNAIFVLREYGKELGVEVERWQELFHGMDVEYWRKNNDQVK